MIVVVIIGMLAAIAIPAFKTVRIRAQNARVINDFRIFKDAFNTCAMELRQWPDDANPGILPVEMKGYILEAKFEEQPPVGGVWDWDNGVLGIKAGLSLHDVKADEDQMQKIDAQIDDGNLNSGQFRAMQSNYYTWILEEE